MRFLEPPLTQTERLQWLVLGGLLFNREHRKDVKASSFSFPDFQQAMNELREGQGYSSLGRLLAMCGVEWDVSSKSPIPEILAALERDGTFSAAINLVNDIIKDTHTKDGDCRKDEFLGRILKLSEAIQHERNRSDDPKAALEHQEAIRKRLDAEKGLK